MGGLFCAGIAFVAWLQVPLATTAPVAVAGRPTWVNSPFSNQAVPSVGAQTLSSTGPTGMAQLGEASSALATYRRLARCVEARSTEKSGRVMAFSAAELCRDLGEESLAQRSLLLERAAQEAEPGAWWAYTSAPVSDNARPSQTEKMKSFQLAAARQGDRDALLALATQAEHDAGDPGKALAYWIAYEQIGQASGMSSTDSMALLEARFRRALSPEEFANSLSEGHQFAQATLRAGCALCKADTTGGATLGGDLIGSIVAAGLGTAPNPVHGDRTAGVAADKIEVCNTQRCEMAIPGPGGVWVRERK